MSVLDPTTEAPVSETPAETPEVQAQVAAVAEVPAVVEQASAPTTAAVSGTELAIQLAESVRITERLQQELQAITGTTQAVQAQRADLLEQIKAETDKTLTLERQLETTQTELEAASQATQTAETAKAEAEQIATEATAKATTAEARAVKLEVITEKFPELLRYKDFIEASEDPAEVAKQCEAFRTARAADVTSIQQQLGGAALQSTVPTGQASRVVSITDDAALADYLAEAFNDPEEFKSRVKQATEGLNASRLQQ